MEEFKRESFQLVPKSVTLNDPILRYFPEFGSFWPLGRFVYKWLTKP